MADSFITLAKLGSSIFTADATGRGKFAAGFVDSTLLAANAAIENLPAGAILQTITATVAGPSSQAANIPWDNTIPQSNEGVQVFYATITPLRANSIIRITSVVIAADAGGGPAITAIFVNGTSNALQSNWAYGYGGLPIGVVDHLPGSTVPIDYSVRAGVGGGGTLLINEGYNFTPKLGASMSSKLILQEIKRI